MLCFNGFTQTIIPSVGNSSLITQNTTWSDPVYYIQDDIIVENGATLTITQGVSIIFKEDYFESYENPIYNDDEGNSDRTGIFILDGSLIIGKPHPTLPTLPKVVFTPDNINLGWEGIIFESSNNQYSEVKFATIENVIKTQLTCGPSSISDGAIFIKNMNNILIENCIIRNNIISKRGGGIIVSLNVTGIGNSNPENSIRIINNDIYENTALKGGGICLFSTNSTEKAFAYISGNNIYNNTSSHSGGGISLLRKAEAEIVNNLINGNNANCENNNSEPEYNGGGGLVVGYDSYALIDNNTIVGNSTIYNPLSNAKTGYGGGILLRLKSEIEANNNYIEENFAKFGGGFCITNGSGLSSLGNGGPSNFNLNLNTLVHNYAQEDGGGIYITHSYGELYRNTISYNTSNYGAGIYLNSTSDDYGNSNNISNLFNNKIYSNSSSVAGAIWIEGELSSNYSNNFNIFNNLIYNNITTNYAAAVYVNSNVNLNFNNNTVCKNYTEIQSDGDGTFIELSAQNNNLSFVNNIFYFNGLNQIPCQINHYNYQPNDFMHNSIMNLGCAIPPDNNHDLVPEFLDVQNNDFRLQGGSPLIDIGYCVVNPMSNYDMDMKTRVNGDCIDIGAYEYWELTPPPIAENQEIKLDSLNNNKIKIYPNPASNYLTILIPEDYTTQNLIISNANGKTIINKAIDSEKREISINISSLKPGIYFLTLVSQTEITHYKFIKK